MCPRIKIIDTLQNSSKLYTKGGNVSRQHKGKKIMNKNVRRIMNELANDEKIIDMHLVNICRRCVTYNNRAAKAREMNAKGTLKPFQVVVKSITSAAGQAHDPNNESANIDPSYVMKRIRTCKNKEQVYNVIDWLDSLGDVVYNRFSAAIEIQLDRLDGKVLKTY